MSAEQARKLYIQAEQRAVLDEVHNLIRRQRLTLVKDARGDAP
jgi:hypothetical protein